MSSKKIDNFRKALKSLKTAVTTPIQDNRDMAGIIQNFEFTYETCWNALKLYLEDQGVVTTTARDVFSKAYQLKLIQNDQYWLEMIKDRNLTVHAYNEEFAKEICSKIQKMYLPCFEEVGKLLP